MSNNQTNNDTGKATKPAYIMVQMKMKNLQEVDQRYAKFTFPIIQKHGGQMLGKPTVNHVLRVG